MKIIIDYDSSWRNSFLDGNNNEVAPKKSRRFIGSMTELKKEGNFIQRDITLDTVMGVLNRLIGDQRRLYQARNDENYFFQDIDNDRLIFIDRPSKLIKTEEVTYIRNVTGSTDQKSYTGAIKIHDVMFNSDYSTEFWGVLALDFYELYQFVVNGSVVEAGIELKPLSIMSKLEAIRKQKPIPNSGKVTAIVKVLKENFSQIKPLNNKKEVLTLPLYCSALYLQLERLSKRFDMSSAKSIRGSITGISHNGFTVKDFMYRFTTGEKKKIWGNPYIHEEFVKGEGKVKHLMTKASGQLEINLDLNKDKTKELKTMIDNAGVSSFFLGKKGLAYVAIIR